MLRKALCLMIVFAIPGMLPAGNRDDAVLAAQSQWIESYNHRNCEVLAKIETDDFRVVFGDGRVQNKADQMINIRKPLPSGAEYEIAIETTEVRRYGKAAVMTGVVAEKGKFPNEQGVMQPFSQRSRYTDTWILQKGHWRVVSSHLSDLK